MKKKNRGICVGRARVFRAGCAFDMGLCDDVTVVVDLIVGFKLCNATVVADITTCKLRIFDDAVNTFYLEVRMSKSSIVVIFGLQYMFLFASTPILAILFPV